MSQDHLLIIITVELSEIDPSMNNSDRNPAAASRTSDIEVVIRPATGLRLGSLLEIWRYRGLIASMSNRQMRMRFSDMWLGLFWILARPITMTLVFVFIRNLSEARMGGGIPYPAFVFSGLVLWFYMAGTIGEVANALQRDAGLVQKGLFSETGEPNRSRFCKSDRTRPRRCHFGRIDAVPRPGAWLADRAPAYSAPADLATCLWNWDCVCDAQHCE